MTKWTEEQKLIVEITRRASSEEWTSPSVLLEPILCRGRMLIEKAEPKKLTAEEALHIYTPGLRIYQPDLTPMQAVLDETERRFAAVIAKKLLIAHYEERGIDVHAAHRIINNTLKDTKS